MIKVGLTGGIGCGKSTAVDAFHALGTKIIDADQIAKDVVAIGKPALNEIANKLGDDILNPDGSLNRALLKERVFSDKKMLNVLESILHPKIRQEIEDRIANSNDQPYIIVDVPLLVEKDYQSLFERIIVVDCLPEQQIERVQSRDNMQTDTIEKVMQTQASRQERKSHATDILDNTGDKNSLLAQVKRLHDTFIDLSTV